MSSASARVATTVLAASQSAEVARIVLEQQLVVDTRRPAVQRGIARDRIAELGRHYEEVRASDPGTGNRTQTLDAVVVDMRSVARDAQFDPADIVRLLSSTAAGERLAGLAAIEATGDPSAFEAVLAATVKPQTPFEGYHALRALETLAPSLTAAQRTELERSLDKGWRQGVAHDTARAALADRVLASVAQSSAPSL